MYGTTAIAHNIADLKSQIRGQLQIVKFEASLSLTQSSGQLQLVNAWRFEASLSLTQYSGQLQCVVAR